MPVLDFISLRELTCINFHQGRVVYTKCIMTNLFTLLTCIQSIPASATQTTALVNTSLTRLELFLIRSLRTVRWAIVLASVECCAFLISQWCLSNQDESKLSPLTDSAEAASRSSLFHCTSASLPSSSVGTATHFPFWTTRAGFQQNSNSANSRFEGGSLHQKQALGENCNSKSAVW